MIVSFKDYELARANLRDSVRIRRFEKLIFPKDAYPLLEIWMLFLTPRIHNFKVLSPEGHLAGFLSLSRPWLARQPAWVITVGVHPDHQRCGIGRFMLQWAERYFELERVRLTVRASNDPAIALYEQIGYCQITRRRRYYLDGEDGLIMEKRCTETVHSLEDAQS
jgi:ribosomal protein S18 acetylase RimI-like enzyme